MAKLSVDEKTRKRIATLLQRVQANAAFRPPVPASTPNAAAAPQAPRTTNSTPTAPSTASPTPQGLPATVSARKARITGPAETQPQQIPIPSPGKSTPATPPAAPPATPARPNAMDERLRKMEESLHDLQALRDLSELLSVQYNPFLSLEESSTESSNNVNDLLRKQFGKSRPEDKQLDAVLASSAPRNRGNPAPHAPPRIIPEPEPEAESQWYDESETLHINPPRMPLLSELLDEGEPAPTPRRNPMPHPQSLPQPAAREVPAVNDATAANPRDSRLPNPQTSGFRTGNGPKALFQARGASSLGGPREAYLAMNWFTYLSQGTDSAVIFLYLDYYRYAGWIDEDSHAWLHRLAEGVGTPRPGSKWEDFGMEAKRLTECHLRNLKFLDKLLGTTLQHGEADYLQQTLAMLLED